MQATSIRPLLDNQVSLDVREAADVMSINGFQQLFRCLHLADNSAQIPVGQPGHDRLFKVRGLLDIFSLSLSLNIISIRRVRLTRP